MKNEFSPFAVSGYLSGQSTEDRAHLLRFRLLHAVAAVLAVPVRGQRCVVAVPVCASERSVREHRAEAQQTALLAHYAE